KQDDPKTTEEETKREDVAAAFVRKILPQLPADCVYDEEQHKPPENRGVYHILLLGQGGSGKTHIVQNLIFPIVHFIWPAEGEEDSMMVVAAKNAQAKNISTDQVAAKTLHAASCMRVQSLSNGNMTAGTAEKRLKTLWNSIRVLIIEEISMVSAMMYNMLDFRAMLGRRVAWHLRPTAQLSLLDDLDAKNADGELKYEAVAPEVQHAQEVFANIPDVQVWRSFDRPTAVHATGEEVANASLAEIPRPLCKRRRAWCPRPSLF
ncbi:unnamed protein product, partial [Durusdinium trenchii]